MSTITIETKSLENVFKKLSAWIFDMENGVDLKKSADKIVLDLRKKIRTGRTGDGSKMHLVSEATMDMPISGSRDRRKRRDVNGSREPLVATGESVSSIKAKKHGNEYRIGATGRGKKKFSYNEAKRTSRSGRVIPSRDPFVTGEDQLTILESELLKSLDKALR